MGNNFHGVQIFVNGMGSFDHDFYTLFVLKKLDYATKI